MNQLSMTRRSRGPVLALGAILLLLAGGVRAQEPLIINEVLADPASDWDGDGAVDYKGDEWVEVANVGPDVIDMSTYWLRDDSGADSDFQLAGLIAPGAVAVFYGSDVVAWQTANGLSTTGLSLNNGGDLLYLSRSIPGSTELELMYVVHYEDHMAEDDRSSGWNEERSDWELFDGLNPYTGGLPPVANGCAPTPGVANICGGSVADEPISFGEIKATYR